MTTATKPAAKAETGTVVRRPPTEEFRVAANTNPQALGSAIAHAIYDNRKVVLRAIGPESISQGLKSICIARGFVAPRGFDLTVVPGWDNVTGNSGDAVSAMMMQVLVR